jgi:hypothetical protein
MQASVSVFRTVLPRSRPSPVWGVTTYGIRAKVRPLENLNIINKACEKWVDFSLRLS